MFTLAARIDGPLVYRRDHPHNPCREALMFNLHRAAYACAALACIASALTLQAAERERPALEVGSIPENDLGKDIEGNRILVSDLHGKVVIVSFWASWCGPCLKELPVLAGVAKQVGPEHLQIIAINYKDESERFRYVVKVLKDFQITMLRDQYGKAATKYK